jgi:hypothetical protein
VNILFNFLLLWYVDKCWYEKCNKPLYAVYVKIWNCIKMGKCTLEYVNNYTDLSIIQNGWITQIHICQILERYCYIIIPKCPTSLFSFMNHLLPIEKGRHLAIDHNNRVCSLCPYQAIGDEFHYLFECSYFNDIIRKSLLPRFYIHPNIFKLDTLMNSYDKNILLKLSLFCKNIMLKFR